ncbi:MAG: DNA ligase [Methylotenera sp. RIFCSPLOWO2_02_FULL_45_14]|nr:MAG: DNA ligase [Methylotenera sp. RIFCSPLOWO2_02_FULL_45_14]
MKLIRLLLLIAIAGAPVSPLLAEQVTSDVLLAQVYQRGIDVRKFLVSEKFDGVRAVWDGKIFHTRSGRVIAAPAWFTQGFPATPLDGELWLARGKFEALSGAVRKNVPIDEEWRGISYLIFELPNEQGTFQVRAQRIVEIVKQANIPHLKAVTQFRVKDETVLNSRLKQVVALGGEGLMLHRADAQYVTGRSDALLKLKLQNDAEATVVAHTPGRGKYTGKLGALVVETPEGIRFKLGTGLSDAQRENPPKIGSLVTYTYRDKTASGKPRFASFLRVRHE